ncbi:MAG TPA: hypothetical protein VK524_00325 [Polyangiaceae bacterium]|nr:hypothetical protein [Polyangiaceae bacterium]
MRTALTAMSLSILAVACGGSTHGGAGGASGNAGTAGSGGTGGSAGSGGNGGTSQVPLKHRPSATACDQTRPEPDPMAPDAGGPPIECRSHAECTAGINGRCGGNGHDGWRCTYDQCFADGDCTGADTSGVCECEGGFRSDNNQCLREGNCKTNADCGSGGYCSPTLGTCGNYTKIVGYYCHTPQDECVNDSDCSGAGANWYCAYSPMAGHWKCSNSHCVG